MKRMILHIGAEKTGSTSIQWFLDKNRELLHKQGIYIPDFLSDCYNHRIMPTMAFNLDRIDDFVTEQGLHDEKERKKAYAQWQELFHQTCGKDQHDAWIISSEHLQSRLTTREEIKRIRNLLKGYFDDISILLYIRNPIEAAISFWSTLVRKGYDVTKLPEPGNWRIRNNCDYKSIISRWEEVFPGKVVVRIFDKNHFTGNDLMSDFMGACKIAHDEGFSMPKKQNETLSYAAIVLLSAINRKLNKAGKQRAGIRKRNMANVVGRKFARFANYRPSEQEVAAYREYYEESNEWTRSRYFPHMDQLFDSPVMARDSDAALEWDHSEAYDSLCDLIVDLCEPGVTATNRNSSG